jgi:hypothetical protein
MDIPDDMPVWVQEAILLCDVENGEIKNSHWSEYEWRITEYKYAIRPLSVMEYPSYKKGSIVIACTPYGKPDKDWRP